jgi:hypothetical protein
MISFASTKGRGAHGHSRSVPSRFRLLLQEAESHRFAKTGSGRRRSKPRCICEEFLTDIQYGNMHYDNRTQAQAIIDQAGRRAVIPPPVVPPLSPPITNADYHAHDCAAPPAPPPPPPGPPAPPPPPPPSSFAAGKCTKNRVSQQWSLSDGVVPGDGKPTNVLSAMHGAPGEPQSLCWEIAECSDRGTLHY